MTVKRLQPFESLASTARFVIELAVDDAAAFATLAALLADHRGARGEVRARVAMPQGEARLLLGRDFLLDGELVERIEALPGIGNVEMKSSETRLSLVG